MAVAPAQGQFEVYFQPQYRIGNGRLVGAEARVRWKHPEWGLRRQPLFPCLKRMALSPRWINTSGIRPALRAWDDKGYPPISISVNVSRADVYNTNLADMLLQIVRKYKLAASCLPLELTESTYTVNPNQIIETVRSLKKLRFEIEMDDFGSGYSSLNMLNQMPLNVLKPDIQFVQNETAKLKNRSILPFIMEIARFMGLRVVAEGVETPKQLERLRELGCDYTQGYYFAKPLLRVEFEKLLAK